MSELQPPALRLKRVTAKNCLASALLKSELVSQTTQWRPTYWHPLTEHMFNRPKAKKEHERYYLLPGQGGQAYRRKQRFILKWAIVVGLLVAGGVAGLIYWINRPKL